MSLLASITAHVVCDECSQAGPSSHGETGAKSAARAAARAAGWKRRLRETPRTNYWIDVCDECAAKESTDATNA